MIKDPPATTSTKHHSAPPHPAHKTATLHIDKAVAKKEERAVEKLKRQEDKVLAKCAADKDACKAALIITNFE
eukprot:scaffold16941_cov36-Attheya_sp.AAC.1